MRFGVHCRLWSRAWSDENVDLIQHARDLGYSAFEITISNLPRINAKAIRQRAEAVGIEVIATLSLAKDCSLATSDGAIRQRAVAFLRTAVERAREMGSRLVVGPIYAVVGQFTGEGPSIDELDWIADGLREVSLFAKTCDVSLALEPINRYETYLLNTAAQAQAMVDRIGEKNVGLLLDTYHMNIEERGIADTLARHKASLLHLHLNESDRGMLGGGNIDWGAVFTTLKEIRYQGRASIECFSFVSPESPAITPVWRALFSSPDDVARAGLAFLAQGIGNLY